MSAAAPSPEPPSDVSSLNSRQPQPLMHHPVSARSPRVSSRAMYRPGSAECSSGSAGDSIVVGALDGVVDPRRRRWRRWRWRWRRRRWRRRWRRRDEKLLPPPSPPPPPAGSAAECAHCESLTRIDVLDKKYPHTALYPADNADRGPPGLINARV